MNDETDRHKKPGTAGWAAILVVVPMIYVLSIGPVGYLAQQFSLPPSMKGPFLAFYGPVIWLHDHTSLKGPIERYSEWWGRLARRP